MTHLTTTTTENIWSSIKRTNTQVPNLEWNRQLLCTTEFKAERYSYYDDNNDSMKKKQINKKQYAKSALQICQH